MLSKKIQKTMLFTALLLISVTSLAFARGGMGYGDCPRGGGGGCGGQGMGYGMMGGGQGHGGYGPGANLTEEQKTKVEAAREKFFTETEALRIQMRDKHFALQDEMNKKTPDSAKVAQLQKELSQVEAEFDQKAVQHRLEMRKIVPDGYHGRGFGRGPGGCDRF